MSHGGRGEGRSPPSRRVKIWEVCVGQGIARGAIARGLRNRASQNGPRRGFAAASWLASGISGLVTAFRTDLAQEIAAIQRITPFYVVQNPSRGRARVLRLGLQKLTDWRDAPLRRYRAGTERHRDDGGLRARRPGVRRTEWRAAIHVLAGHFIRGQLRDQSEVDEYWRRLSASGEPNVCGWLKERYGVSWQIVPRALKRMLADRDARRAARVMRAIMRMTKLEIGKIKQAFNGL